MKLHYAPPEASYSACGRYCYNSTTLQFTADPAEADCLSCKNAIRRQDTR